MELGQELKLMELGQELMELGMEHGKPQQSLSNLRLNKI
jgi:hypothetical protein